MVNWKNSFEKINAELEQTKRKKQALDNLHEAGRISQFAYECLNKGLTQEIEHAEAQQKALAEQMTTKLNELEEQRMALEMFLANTEMAHAAGEINEELYAKESSALDLGLEATKQELNWIKEVIIQLVPKEGESEVEPTPTPTENTETTTTETTEAPTTEATVETPSDMPVEVPVEVTATSEVNVEQIQPPTETPESTTPTTSEGGEAPFREQGEDTPT